MLLKKCQHSHEAVLYVLLGEEGQGFHQADCVGKRVPGPAEYLQASAVQVVVQKRYLS